MKTPTPASPRLLSAAVLLPCIGLFLLMPPVIQLFASKHDIAGVPLIVVYLFGVWLGLIVVAAWLSQRLDAPVTPGAGKLPGRSADEGADRQA
jgi:hypothetical protein